MNRPVALSSWCWHEPYHHGQFSLFDAPAAVARHGCRWLEANDFMLPPPRLSRLRRPAARLRGLPEHSWRYASASFATLKAQLTAHHVDCLAWTIDSDFCTQSTTAWRGQQAYLRQALAAVAQLQPRVLRVTLGGDADASAHVDQVVVERFVDWSRSVWTEFPALTLAIENHWGITTDSRRLLELLDGIRTELDPHQRHLVGICFDPGNVPEAERETHWQRLIPHTVHLHWKTIAFDADGNESSLPYDVIWSELADSGFAGSMTVEFEGELNPEAGVAQSLKLLQRYGLIPIGAGEAEYKPQPNA